MAFESAAHNTHVVLCVLSHQALPSPLHCQPISMRNSWSCCFTCHPIDVLYRRQPGASPERTIHRCACEGRKNKEGKKKKKKKQHSHCSTIFVFFFCADSCCTLTFDTIALLLRPRANLSLMTARTVLVVRCFASAQASPDETGATDFDFIRSYHTHESHDREKHITYDQVSMRGMGMPPRREHAIIH